MTTIPTTEATRNEQITSGLTAPILEQELQFGDVHFSIRKLLPMEGYRLFEKIRPALEQLGAAFSTIENPQSVNTAGLLLKVVGAIPEDALENARQQLWRQVIFTAPTHPQPTPLMGNEDAAFRDLTFYHIYELLVRCLVVNFFESWGALQSRIPSEIMAMIQSASATSPPSSPTP